MKIKLNKPFGSNSDVDEFDVKQIKKALNRLGYYMPFEKIGITGIPDAEVFTALKTFQSDQGLEPTGTAKPDDETVKSLSSIAAKKKSGKYIWRTAGDDRVRGSHAALDKTVRDLSDSPDPGEEFNCRCWAEFVTEEGLKQKLISKVNGAARKWTEEDFADHFYNGNGQTITLLQTGYLGEIIEKAREVMFHRVEDQVGDKMREIKSGKLVYTTENSYTRLGEVFWVFGGGTIRTKTEGIVTKNGNTLSIEATVDYEYDDTFTDPLRIREHTPLVGTSDPDEAPDWYVKLTDAGGTHFRITDRWKTRMTGSISLNKKG
ncbi:MAG: hypothetical protein DHS20C02_13580 [Micavibrio sp.]|nr:MAG: hypothetical protein DHS20C02_13580 [Micavibrio sp.]